MTKLFFVDTETTHRWPSRAGLVQISAIIEIDGKVKEELTLNAAPFPQDSIDPVALEVNGLTNEEISAFPDPKSTYLKLTRTLDKYVDKFDKRDKFFLVAYNASFDTDMLREFWKKNGDNYFGSYFWTPSLCTMQLAANHLMDSRSNMVDFKLGTTAFNLGIKADGNLHDAQVDNRISRTIYKIVKGEAIDVLPEHEAGKAEESFINKEEENFPPGL